MLRELFIGLLFSVSGAVALLAQHPAGLGYFNAEQVNESVFLSWTLDSGLTCQGIEIYRGTANEEMQQVGQIPGFCGSVSKATSYDFTDHAPRLGVDNFYMLVLGSVGNSDTLSILVTPDLGEQVMVVPTSDRMFKLVFENPTNEKVECRVYDAQGGFVHSEETSQQHVHVVMESGAGVYFALLVFRETGRKLTAKWVVD